MHQPLVLLMFGIIDYPLNSEGSGIINYEDPTFLFFISDFLSSSSTEIFLFFSFNSGYISC